jgi:hypothetical protein
LHRRRSRRRHHHRGHHQHLQQLARVRPGRGPARHHQHPVGRAADSAAGHRRRPEHVLRRRPGNLRRLDHHS